MGILGSAFGRALAGGGAAAVGMTNKWIDEELATQRAQAFADIRRNSANQERADADAFNNDPARIERDRQRRSDDALAAGKTAEQVQLSANTNQPLIDAVRGRTAGDTAAASEAATTAKIAAAKRMATDPDSTEAQRAQAAIDLEKLTAELKARANSTIDVVKATEQARADSGAYDRRTGVAADKLPPAVKAELDALDKRDEQINAAMVRAQADGMWDPAKNPSQKQLQTQQAATRMRRSQILQPYLGGGGADPLGLRGGGGDGGGGSRGSTDPTTDAAKLEAIKAEAARVGDKDYLVNVAGQKHKVGNPQANSDDGPNLLQRASSLASSIGDTISGAVSGMRETGSALQAIRDRVREAGSGGAPLTDQERQEARRYGIQVPA